MNPDDFGKFALEKRTLDILVGYLFARTCETHGWLLNWSAIDANGVCLSVIWILSAVLLVWITNKFYKVSAEKHHKDKTLKAWEDLAQYLNEKETK